MRAAHRGGHREADSDPTLGSGARGQWTPCPGPGGPAEQGDQRDAVGSYTVEESIAEIRAGKKVVIVDDPDRENEVTSCIAAET